WGVTEKRSLLTRLFAYWATVTVGPLALGTGISISSWLFAVDVSNLGLGSVREVLLGIAPLLLTALGFTVLYVALPARTVRWRHAFGGAVLAALLFEALKFGFGVYVDAAGSFASIYGPLAALPLFLMWMYLAWAVILLGAVAAASWPEWQALRRERAAPATAVRQMMRALLVLQRLRDAGAATETIDDEMLLEATGGNNVALGAVLGGLREAGLVARTEAGTLVLARDLDGVTLHHVRDALGFGLGDLATKDVGEPAWQPEFERLVAVWDETGRRVLDVPVKHLFDEAPDGGTPLAITGGRDAGQQRAGPE
ncbi:MAG: YhjD/YihY/BrkB family envelope integrity protein, partial [Alphaproteobacteria bacterium]